MNSTSEIDVNDPFEVLSAAFPILKIKNDLQTFSHLNEAKEAVKKLGIENKFPELILDCIRIHLRRYVVPKFWHKLSVSYRTQYQGYLIFIDAVNYLYEELLIYVPIMERVKFVQDGKESQIYGEPTLLASLKLVIHGTLYSQLTYPYCEVVNNFYEVCLRLFSHFNQYDDSELALDDKLCKRCEFEIVLCQCQVLMENFKKVNSKLLEMDLLERLVIQEVISLIHTRIELHVKETCKSVYDVSYLDQLETWVKDVVMSWLSQIFCSYPESDNQIKEKIDKSLHNYQEKLLQYLREVYLKVIIDQLFYVIIEYPDSQPIIDDVRKCLPETNMRPLLTEKLQQALKMRLLHQGVSTPDILTAFIATIRALRRLDPTGVLLDTVTEPVRKYLRTREDTVRCVVTNLTEEGSSELADELVKGEALQLDDGLLSDEETDDWETWMPDPVDADPTKTSKCRRTSDIISMLVNVFGSKELFVNEYRTLLADRLLSQSSCNTEKEIRYLELLKVRFGDSQLHYCEVMLKDICDSKRINGNLQNDVQYVQDSKGFPATALILSAQFWPPFKEETLELLPEVQNQFEVYTKGFEALKGNRTLCWKPHLGFVELEIECENRVLNLTVSPMLATIIMHFQNKNEWTIEELCQTMKVPPTLLRRRLHYWQIHGVIREDNANTFVLTENNESKNKGTTVVEMACEEEEMESALASAHDQREEELQVFWSYIVGMLTNLESMSLDRIHQMLKMFVSEGPTAMECSIQELRQFLEGKVREHKLVISAGLYRLPSN